MAVGFSSLGSFSARFSALVGESPREYRNRWAALGGPRVPGCYLFICGVLDPPVLDPPADFSVVAQSGRSESGVRRPTVEQ